MGPKSFRLRELPSEERPRERLQRYGPEALSHAELLAILLRTGSAQESAIHVAIRLLQEYEGSLRKLADCKWEELTLIHGIGPAKALQLQASIELGRRISRSHLPDKITITCPQDAAELLNERLRFQAEEHFICLFLNTKNQVIGHQTLSIGSLNASIVHPREVFKAAIRRSSAGIICAHNHPSGDPSPSKEDIKVTKRLAQAGQLLGIQILDHLVIGDQRFVSLKELGYL